LRRPFDKHIDNHELDALVPSSSETGQELHGFSPDAVREAKRHLQTCGDCHRKVSKYGQLVNQLSNVAVSEGAPQEVDCPDDSDVEWHEVAAGLWPEPVAAQLIMHAALCDHCGPLLRAATSVDDDPTLQEENLLAELKTPSWPGLKAKPIPPDPWELPVWRRFLQWKILAPALALILIVGVLTTRPPSSPAPLSGSMFADFAVRTHRQHAQGSLPLDVRSDSQQALNEWFKAKSQLPLDLPASPPIPGEERPYRLEGARLMKVGGKSAAFIAYQMQTGPVSLIVTPDSVAVASGGVAADYKKVSFHYLTVEGYKVVTWSLHGQTYALVSQEGNSTQRSCMVCHSAMRDRDLSHTPTPLSAVGNAAKPVLQ
jgi:anti-sigma factor RsiW